MFLIVVLPAVAPRLNTVALSARLKVVTPSGNITTLLIPSPSINPTVPVSLAPPLRTILPARIVLKLRIKNSDAFGVSIAPPTVMIDSKPAVLSTTPRFITEFSDDVCRLNVVDRELVPILTNCVSVVSSKMSAVVTCPPILRVVTLLFVAVSIKLNVDALDVRDAVPYVPSYSS